MQWILAVKETVVIKPSKLNIVVQGLSNSIPVPFISHYTHLSLSLSLESQVGSDQAAGKRAGRVPYKKTERLRGIYISHTPSGKPDGIALHYTCTTPEALHWASPRGRPQHWYVKRARRVNS